MYIIHRRKNIFCQKCGNKVENGEVFCGMCGNPLNINTVAREEKVMPKKKKRKWPIIVVLFFLFCIGCAVFGPIYQNANSNKDPVEVVKNCYKAIEEKDYSAFTKCLYSEFYPVSEKEFTEMANMYDGVKVSVGSVQRLSEDAINDARVDLKEEFGVEISSGCVVPVVIEKGNDKVNIIVSLVQIDEKWYVIKMQ